MGNSNLISICVISSLVILLSCYIAARVMSKKGTMTITTGVLDKTLILLSPVLFFIVWCIGFEDELSPLQIILLVLSGLMLLGSMVLSIKANLSNWVYALLSVMAKLSIFVFTNIVLLILLVILFFYVFKSFTNHNDSDGTFIIKYDHFLDRWVGYRVD